MKTILLMALALLTLTLSFNTTYADTKNQPQTITLNPEEVEKFSQAIAQVKSYYVTSISDKKLLENAIAARHGERSEGA